MIGLIKDVRQVVQLRRRVRELEDALTAQRYVSNQLTVELIRTEEKLATARNIIRVARVQGEQIHRALLSQAFID